MGWYSKLRDKVLYPVAGFALGSTVGAPGIGASIAGGLANADEASPKSPQSTNKPLVKNTVSREAVVRTSQVSGLKDVNYTTNSATQIDPQILMFGGFGIIVLMLLIKR